MKYVKQFAIILVISFLGELLHTLLPWPIPASIYGMVLLFLALQFRVIKLEQVQDTGAFLSGLLPLLFVAPAVNLMDYWHLVAPAALQVIFIVAASTVVVFFVSGAVTQWCINHSKGGKTHE